MIFYSKKRKNNQEILTLFNKEIVICNDLNKKFEKYTLDDYKRSLEIKYFLKFKRFLNLKNPKLFTEKIQWLKLYDCLPIKTTLSDKIAVREYIKEKIGGEYLKKIFKIYNSFEEIDFSDLPDDYVIKTNHGCKMQIIVLKGGIIEYDKLKKRFDDYLDTNHAYKSGFELQYKDIKPKIFIEEFIKNTNELFEYLFFCFNGKPEYVLFASGKRSPQICCTMFDMEWNNLHFNYGDALHQDEIPKPKNFQKMIDIAKILSKDFKFVRVDLHNIDGKIYFGEMTFTPASGFMKFNPPEYDRILGEKLNLN